MVQVQWQKTFGGVAAVTVLVSLALVVGTTGAVEGYYSHAVVESCQGCQLNRLPDVKSFIFEDLPQYDKVKFKHIQGAPPELVLYNEQEHELERLKLAQLTREECNKLLASKGFQKSKAKDDL